MRSHPRIVIWVNYYVGAFDDGAVGILVVVFSPACVLLVVVWNGVGTITLGYLIGVGSAVVAGVGVGRSVGLALGDEIGLVGARRCFKLVVRVGGGQERRRGRGR